jgi:hypothetical protein
VLGIESTNRIRPVRQRPSSSSGSTPRSRCGNGSPAANARPANVNGSAATAGHLASNAFDIVAQVARKSYIQIPQSAATFFGSVAISISKRIDLRSWFHHRLTAVP